MTQSYFETGLIEEPCQKKCRCKHRENSSKIQVAHCDIELSDNFLECNVEWPVLFLTIKQVQFTSSLLASCRRIRRILITTDSLLVVLMPEMFKYNEQLEVLVVQAPIQTIESQFLKYLNSLKQLVISETRIEQLSISMFEDCLMINQILLSSNQISLLADRTFENCNKLQKLDLSNNKLTVINHLTFNKGNNLQILNLGKNKITRIDDFSFKNLKKLHVLNLNDNLLKVINKDTFGNMENLYHLSLETNLIDYINDEAFLSLKSIRTINLKNNFLLRLDLVLFVNLNNLNVSFSNIKCVLERNDDYLLVSPDVRKSFESLPLCSGTRKPIEKKQKLVQINTISIKPEINSIDKQPNDKYSISYILDKHPYLFPMIFGGLTVLLISVIVIAVVCHVKNKQIIELRMNEISLPMMQSTL